MSKNILLVDDNTAFRKSVRKILESENYSVFDFECAIAALPAIKKENIKLVITDILMPEIEGNRFAQKVKEINPSLKIIGMTGGGRAVGSSELIKDMCLPHIFEMVISKPFLAEDLIDEIKKYI